MLDSRLAAGRHNDVARCQRKEEFAQRFAIKQLVIALIAVIHQAIVAGSLAVLFSSVRLV